VVAHQNPSAKINAIRSNLVYDNGVQGEGVAIDLGVTGPNGNDAGDVDGGANLMQNFPTIERIVLAGVTRGLPTDVPATVGGRLDAPAGSYRIDAYFSHRCDPVTAQVPGRGHAEAFIGTKRVDLTGGATAFDLPVVIPELVDTAVVSLTATDANGNTSEIGTCFAVGNAGGDSIFSDGFEALGTL
jgi:hypothetical protein